jgi:hypothetical protein
VGHETGMAFRIFCISAGDAFVIFISAPNSQHVKVKLHFNPPPAKSFPSVIQHRVPFVTNNSQKQNLSATKSVFSAERCKDDTLGASNIERPEWF